MANYIYRLSEIYSFHRPSVGGKGANLGDLARGLNVPPGFCLSSVAYHQTLENQGLNEMISDLLRTVNETDLKDLEAASEKISGIILAAPLLPDVESSVREAFADLAADRAGLKVAVRSSATAEDLEDASFAGQQETFLNVEGIEDVLIAIKKCWASLWTARAMHYRAQKGFAHATVRMAVIIQEMIPAEVSGVMFTANPVSNRREEIVIEAVRGLGEQLVSGHQAGDVYVFKKQDTRVDLIEQSIADPALGPMLNEYDVRELAHTGLKIEKYYDNFQDIEWAYHKGKFYFLQTRPITTLADEELPNLNLDAMSKMQQELMDWVAERFPDPILPIDGVVVKVLMMAQLEAMQAHGYKVDDLDWTLVERGLFPEFFVPPRIRPGLIRFLPYLRLGQTLGSDPAAEWAGEQVYLLETLKKLKGRDISQLPFEIIIDYITEGLHHLHFFTVMRYNYFVQNRIPAALLLWFLKATLGDDGAVLYEDLLAGTDHITLQINKSLRQLAIEVKDRPEVCGLVLECVPEEIIPKLETVSEGSEFKEKFASFLEVYGERETTMGLGGIASPTWQENPEVVLGMIRGMLQEKPEDEKVREESGRKRAIAAEKVVNERLSRGILSVLRLKPLFHKFVRHARSFAAFRENSHYDVTRSLHVFRILFNELGRRFVRSGLLKNPEDIIYLSYYEIKEIIFEIYHGLREINQKELAAKIESRRAERERRISRWKNRHIEIDNAAAVKGVPASHGIISGPARIITDPRQFHRVSKGDILIAPYTNPSWTPLFTTAAGLIVETGGAASHAAIIAREYAVPAVMGVAGATEIFTDGEIITVNGTTGTVVRSGGNE